MFSHQGDKRTYWHNVKLAALLSLVAGVVNTTGLLSVKTLTTNVTGHFAYFSEDLTSKNYTGAAVYLLFILSFLGGSFAAHFLIQVFSRLQSSVSFAIPMMIETIILALTGMIVNPIKNPQLIGSILLFAMGLQNSLVTHVSNSVVRTTHLTGLFTDLGIELSQLCFFQQLTESKKLHESIRLKAVIIACFFSGCIMAGSFFSLMGLKTLLIAAAILLLAQLYDRV